MSEEPSGATPIIDTLHASVRGMLSSKVHHEIQRMCKPCDIKANQTKVIMVCSELMKHIVEENLNKAMKESQVSKIDPEDEAEFNHNNPDPEL